MTNLLEKKSLKLPLELDQIKNMIPHRYPFLLIDRVNELNPGVSGVAIKNVTANEPFFQGHFPGEAIMPGVLIIEAMAQLIAVIYVSKALVEVESQETSNDINYADRVGYLAAVKNIKFKHKVVPGDQLVLRAKVVGKMGVLSQVQVWAEVNGKTVVEGSISVSEKM
ncbi:3-hydroxyacyl-ACP dehydratase FabZ [Priestia megaterium]|uniref:3-hydroxyacyl-ACP dehydratase FabZ n=1 Tax=Priestia megaterium TaxID=1404 RepID=UPI00245317C0|nr:3-hydroxyacyl-ACP dehydratase FabZ [Priestia megaterium]MDH3155974.1 3-hydroxyacyl-ACP dehydratase FabZ [Priestia megaterium]MED4116323.1 3-hydroxyacyl-ACP dehydratase FabZ [Priestia megaterium]